MPVYDARVDAYIEKAAPFAKPILTKLRKIIFRACPEVTETIKWSFPNYEIHGAVLCSMAAFKAHCSFGFWKASLLKDEKKILQISDRNSMGHLDKLTSTADLPADAVLIQYLKEAEALNKNKIKVKRTVTPRKPLAVPDFFRKALAKNKKAGTHFETFSPSQRNEYVEWLTDAKTDKARDTRLATALEWLEEGKNRNWKYQKAK